VFLALKLWYRCPQCRGKPVRAFEALPDVHFRGLGDLLDVRSVDLVDRRMWRPRNTDG